jgi:hypothetical protein
MILLSPSSFQLPDQTDPNLASSSLFRAGNYTSTRTDFPLRGVSFSPLFVRLFLDKLTLAFC